MKRDHNLLGFLFENFTTQASRTRTIHTTDKAQATASLEAVAVAIEEVVLRQMIESANTVVLADTTIIPITQLPPPRSLALAWHSSRYKTLI